MPAVAPVAAPPAPKFPGLLTHLLELPGTDEKRDPVLTVRFTPGLIKGSGVLTAVLRRSSVTYTVVGQPSPWEGRSFHLWKVPDAAAGDDKDNDAYDVFVAASGREQDNTCGCKGRARHGHCKHGQTLAALIANGWL